MLGTDLTRTTDFGTYAKALCLNIAEIQATRIILTCESDPMFLDLDTVTALGIVLAELVTNSYEHAFPGGDGSISVSALAPAKNEGNLASLIVSDNGLGFVPDYGSKRHGLGLVQRLVQQVRGTLEVKSDHGTVWNIRFPVAAVIPLAA